MHLCVPQVAPSGTHKFKGSWGYLSHLGSPHHPDMIESLPSPASPDLMGGAMTLPLSIWAVSLCERKQPVEGGLAGKSLEQATRNVTVKARLMDNSAQC